MNLTEERTIERENVSTTVLAYLRSAFVLRDRQAQIDDDERLGDVFFRGARTMAIGVVRAHQEFRQYIEGVCGVSLLRHEYDTTQITVGGVTDLIYDRVSGGTR